MYTINVAVVSSTARLTIPHVGGHINTTENNITVQLPSLYGFSVGTNLFSELFLDLDPTEYQWGEVVICDCPIVAATVVHTPGGWICSHPHRRERTCPDPLPDPGYAGYYPHYDMLPEDIQVALRRLPRLVGTFPYWIDRGLSSKVPDHKGWKPVRDFTGTLLRVLTPSGRSVSAGSRAEKKMPLHLRRELRLARIAREEREREKARQRRYAGLPYAVRRGTAAWDMYTTQLQ